MLFHIMLNTEFNEALAMVIGRYAGILKCKLLSTVDDDEDWGWMKDSHDGLEELLRPGRYKYTEAPFKVPDRHFSGLWRMLGFVKAAVGARKHVVVDFFQQALRFPDISNSSRRKIEESLKVAQDDKGDIWKFEEKV